MKVYWLTLGADGKQVQSTIPLETPGKYNFAQGAIYRLKLTNIPGRPAQDLYPTLEVVPTGPKTNEFLAHSSVPLEFTEEDFKQVVDRNYIVKVIYLPDPQFQDAGGSGPDEIVSTRLEPGQDPIQEAMRRGSILLVLRMGNIDQGLLHSPPMTAPVPGGPVAPIKPPGVGVPPLMQVPFPVTPIVPGAGVPNPLPVLPGGPVPPMPKVEEKKPGIPEVIIPPALKPEPFEKPGAEPIVPPMPPTPPALIPGEGKATPTLPTPVEQSKGGSTTNPRLPVVPASANQEMPALPPPATEFAPLVPMSDRSPASSPARPELPSLPPLPTPPAPRSDKN